MVKARAFFYVCAGLFLLALSYHLGARSAGAQAPGNPVVAMTVDGFANPHEYVVVTLNGDAYWSGNGASSWVLRGNVFGGPTPTQQESFGSLKVRYRGERGSAQPAAQGR